MCTNSEQKVIDNFRDITRNVEENEILYEILRVVSHFPCYISWYISENRLPLHGTQCIHPKYPAINQCSSRHFLFRPFCPTLSLSIMRDKMAQHGQRAARVRTTWTTKWPEERARPLFPRVLYGGKCIIPPPSPPNWGGGGGVQGGFMAKNVKSGGTSIGQFLSPPPFPCSAICLLVFWFSMVVYTVLYTVRQLLLLLLLLLLCRESPNCRWDG